MVHALSLDIYATPLSITHFTHGRPNKWSYCLRNAFDVFLSRLFERLISDVSWSSGCWSALEHRVPSLNLANSATCDCDYRLLAYYVSLDIMRGIVPRYARQMAIRIHFPRYFLLHHLLPGVLVLFLLFFLLFLLFFSSCCCCLLFPLLLFLVLLSLFFFLF